MDAARVAATTQRELFVHQTSMMQLEARLRDEAAAKQHLRQLEAAAAQQQAAEAQHAREMAMVEAQIRLEQAKRGGAR